MVELIGNPQTIEMGHLADMIAPPRVRDEKLFHVSNLVNEAARIIGGAIEKDYYYPPDQEKEDWVWNIMAMGRISESFLRVVIEEECKKNNSVFEEQVIKGDEDEGIVGTLDGIIRPEGESTPLAIVEMKSKYSSIQSPLENWRYMAQVKSYLKLTHCTVAWMPIIYFPRKGPPNVEVRLWKMRFDPSEIEENWSLILNARDNVMDEREQKYRLMEKV